MKKVTSLGGIFFKCTDVQQMKDWYAKHLGVDNGEYGATFEWRQADDPEKTGSTTWSLFPQHTKYFEPSKKDFMINYRVEDLEGLVAQLKAADVQVTDEIAVYDYGKFVHILDPESNAIELWEPID